MVMTGVGDAVGVGEGVAVGPSRLDWYSYTGPAGVGEGVAVGVGEGVGEGVGDGVTDGTGEGVGVSPKRSVVPMRSVG